MCAHLLLFFWLMTACTAIVPLMCDILLWLLIPWPWMSISKKLKIAVED
jgi:hypothetical protein